MDYAFIHVHRDAKGDQHFDLESENFPLTEDEKEARLEEMRKQGYREIKRSTVSNPSIISHPMHGVLVAHGFEYKGPCPNKGRPGINGMYASMNDSASLHIEIEGSKFKLHYFPPNGTSYRDAGDGCEQLSNALISARTMANVD